MYSRVYRLLEIGCYKLVSEPWSVLSGPELVLLPIVFEWYVELPSILCVVVLTCCLVVVPVVCDMYGSTIGTCCVVPFF